MKVRELMNAQVEACAPTDDLAAVAMIMWRRDCGVVPVLDENRRVLGVITDRDICMALATRHVRPEELRTSEVMTRIVAVVETGDSLQTALQTMKRIRARRLPVVDAQGIFKGVLSLNDLILATGPARPGGLPRVDPLDLIDVLRAISAHPQTGPPKVEPSEELQPA